MYNEHWPEMTNIDYELKLKLKIFQIYAHTIICHKIPQIFHTSAKMTT